MRLSPSGRSVPDPRGENAARRALGRRCVLAAAALWSLSGVITKGLGGLDSSTIAFYRSLFAGLVLLPVVPRSRWGFRPAMTLTVPLFAAMTGLFIAAVRQTTAANAIFLQSTATFWMVPASALLLREPPDRRSVAGIALATVGVAAIVLYGYRGPQERLGIAQALASGVAYAGVVVGMRGLRALDPIWLSAVNNLGGALVLGAWIGATSGSIRWPGAGPGLALVAFGVVQMAIPYALFARGLREIPAPEAGLIALLEPVLNPIWVALFIGEVPTRPTLVGGLFLLSGLVCRYWPGRWPLPRSKLARRDPPGGPSARVDSPSGPPG
jgi:DME family drug/metabolite transporter